MVDDLPSSTWAKEHGGSGRVVLYDVEAADAVGLRIPDGLLVRLIHRIVRPRRKAGFGTSNTLGPAPHGGAI